MLRRYGHGWRGRLTTGDDYTSAGSRMRFPSPILPTIAQTFVSSLCPAGSWVSTVGQQSPAQSPPNVQPPRTLLIA